MSWEFQHAGCKMPNVFETVFMWASDSYVFYHTFWYVGYKIPFVFEGF